MIEILKELKQQSEIEKQKDEFHKKYENYKKMFYKEQLEKDHKIKEL